MFLRTLNEKHWEKNPPMKTSNNVYDNLSSAPCKNENCYVVSLPHSFKRNFPLKRWFSIQLNNDSKAKKSI